MSDVPSDVRSAQERVIAHRPVASVQVSPTVSLPEAATERYAGLVTRSIAFALDGAVVNGCALLVGVVVGLALSVLHLPSKADALVAAVGGIVWLLWSVAYFAFFWSSTGQTPGDRVMRIRVIDGRGGGSIGPVRSIARFGAIILAALPLLGGFLIMLWDGRRRCLQDRLARTLVVHVADAGPAPADIPHPRRD